MEEAKIPQETETREERFRKQNPTKNKEETKEIQEKGMNDLKIVIRRDSKEI